jgi:hypothetical protein
MKAVLFATGLLGLAAVFSLFEPTLASSQPVASSDVRLVSERMPEQAASEVAARTRHGQKNSYHGP